MHQASDDFEGYSEGVGASAPRSIGSDGPAVLRPYRDSRVKEGSDGEIGGQSTYRTPLKAPLRSLRTTSPP